MQSRINLDLTKERSIMKSTIGISFLLVLIISALLYDLAYYDPSYINRNAVTFNINNLNSKKLYN